MATAPATVSLFTASNIPALTALNDDGAPLELGTKFTSSVSGQVTALKFYRSASDTGPDLLDLWTATGTKLASATFQHGSERLADGEPDDTRHDRRQYDLFRVVPHDRRLCGDHQLLHRGRE